MNAGDSLGGRHLIAEGREAEIYEWDGGLVLRLMRSELAGPSMSRSTIASEAARAAGVPTPRVFDTITVDGRPGQVMERVEGPDLFSYMAANPLRLPAVARDLAGIHAALHEIVGPDELDEMHDYFDRRIRSSNLVPVDVRSTALASLGDLPAGSALCHGDFHPGNVLLTKTGPVLIDWTGAVRGDATADFARTRLMLRIGELPPGAPTMIRALARVGRGLLLRLYERAYFKARPIDGDLLRRWTVLCAADRLVDDIPAERDTLLSIARGGTD
ncbi:MAG: phosphotransferase [Actinomycetia bacterium]|nr:phosphotransferase [Actinomycetes bacterium]